MRRQKRRTERLDPADASPSQELALQLLASQRPAELARQVYLQEFPQEQVSLLPEQHQWLLAQLAVW